MDIINLESIKIAEIQAIFKKFLINSIIDKDGDLLITSNLPLFISIDEDKEIIRFFGTINTKYLKRKESDLYKFAVKVNTASSTVKYSPGSEDAIMFEYGLFKHGSVDEDFLVKTLQKITEDINDTRALFPLIDEVLDEE